MIDRSVTSIEDELQDRVGVRLAGSRPHLHRQQRDGQQQERADSDPSPRGTHVGESGSDALATTKVIEHAFTGTDTSVPQAMLPLSPACGSRRVQRRRSIMRIMNDATAANDRLRGTSLSTTTADEDAAQGHDGHEHDGHAHGESDGAVVEGPTERVDRKPLVIALGITSTFLVIEVIGAYISNSLALLADAAHMLTDVAALGLSLFAMWLARRPTQPERTFGHLRAEILAALVNAVTLIVMAIYIFYEAWQRLQEPPEVHSTPLLIVAVAGLCANIAAAWVLSRGGGHEHNLNTRGAFLHVLGDLLGSVATIVAALVIALTGWYAADPILSAVIGGLVVFAAWSLLRESVDVLLEAAPRGMAIADVRKAIDDVPGVAGVHDLHVWTVTSGFAALSAHVETDDLANWSTCVQEIARTLRDNFGIAHVTLQPEPPRSSAHAANHCSFEEPRGDERCLTASRATPRAAHAGHRH